MTSEFSLEQTSSIEWLELFFDLVVIAAIALLSHGLRDQPTWFGLGIFLLLYAAIWMTWVNVVLYADVAGEQTRVRTVLLVMLLVATMAATSPLHHEGRANAFAIAFLVARVLLARRSMVSGRLLRSWPLLQFGGFTIPWIVAMWVDTPWKYALWALAVVVDLAMVVLHSDRAAAAQLDRVDKQYEQQRAKLATRTERIEKSQKTRVVPEGSRRRIPDPLALPDLTTVDVDTTHLDERLGLLVIIVLGEAVTQLVGAAAGREWDSAFLGVALAGFVVLVGLWLLTFSFGFSAAPRSRLGALPPRFGLPLHLLSTLGILLLAAGLGELASEPHETLHGLLLWLMCGGMALHFAVGAVSGAVAHAPRVWLLGYAVPSVVLPLLLPVAAGLLNNPQVAWLLVLPVAWQYVYARAHTDRVVA